MSSRLGSVPAGTVRCPHTEGAIAIRPPPQAPEYRHRPRCERQRSSSNLTTQNRLLLQLPKRDLAAIIAVAEQVELHVGDVLVDATVPLSHAYFPDSGLASFVAVMEDGSMVEAATAGRDGFVGMPLLYGSTHSRSRVIWQVPGSAHRILPEAFVALELEGRFGNVLAHFQQDLLDQMSQVAGCNRRHAIVHRAARWLLMTHDRVDGEEFFLTQEFLATMLGAERPKVTLAAQQLRQAGLIWYRRSFIRVMDRAGLEAASCACYPVIAAAYPGQGPSRGGGTEATG